MPLFGRPTRTLSIFLAMFICLIYVATSFSDVKLLPANAQRDKAWVVEGWTLGCHIIHQKESLDKIIKGQNVTASMRWDFPGPSGSYTVKQQVLSHFSCQDKVWLRINGQTVISGSVPTPNTGYCCEKSGEGCRKSAKDNLSWMNGSKLTVNKGDVIEYGGTTCVCFDKVKGAHGSYCGINHVLFVGSGSGVEDPKPEIKTSTSSTSWNYTSGSTSFPESKITITNGGGGTLPGLKATPKDTWVEVSMSGSGNDQVLTAKLASSAKSFAAKEYTSTITLSGTDVVSKTITVNLTVKGAVVLNPEIQTTASAIDWTYSSGSTSFPESKITITNSGTGTLPTINALSKDTWVDVSISGEGNSQTLTAKLASTAKSFAVKEYTSTITLSGANISSKTITVALSVKEVIVDKPVIKLSSTKIDWVFKLGKEVFPETKIAITNGGTGTLPALKALTNDDWILVTMTGDGNNQSLSAKLTEKVSSLSPKNYTSKISISGTGIDSKVVDVTLEVNSQSTSTAFDSQHRQSITNSTQTYTVYDLRGVRKVVHKRVGTNNPSLKNGLYLTRDNNSKIVKQMLVK